MEKFSSCCMRLYRVANEKEREKKYFIYLIDRNTWELSQWVTWNKQECISFVWPRNVWTQSFLLTRDRIYFLIRSNEHVVSICKMCFMHSKCVWLPMLLTSMESNSDRMIFNSHIAYPFCTFYCYWYLFGGDSVIPSQTQMLHSKFKYDAIVVFLVDQTAKKKIVKWVFQIGICSWQWNW